MSGLTWFKFYPDDFQNGVRHMTLEEVGAYVLILTEMYRRGGAIPDNEREICGLLRCDVRVWRRLRDSLARRGKITPDQDGVLTNARVHKEVTSAELIADVRRKFGQLGGQQSAKSRANSRKNNETAEAKAQANGEAKGQAYLEAQNITLTSNEVRAPKPVPSPRPEIREAWDAWNATARRMGWPEASKLTPARRSKIAARLNEHGLPIWQAMVERLPTIGWIVDPSRRTGAHLNWRPSLDWFSKAETFLKLVEGAYGAPLPAGSTPNEDLVAQTRLRMYRATGRWSAAWGPEPQPEAAA